MKFGHHSIAIELRVWTDGSKTSEQFQAIVSRFEFAVPVRLSTNTQI